MVEVLLAAYNGERYLREQIDSILNQTYGQVRLITADDGSGDRTLDILEEYAGRYPDKVTIAEFDGPTGSPQGNFFRLIGRTDEEYVMFCDQDDVWIPNKIELSLKRMQEMEVRFGKDMPILVHGDLAVVDENLNVIHPSMRRYQKIAPQHDKLRHYLVENNITGNTVMINKALLALLKAPPAICCMHDWWMGLVSSCFGEISYIEEPLTFYRQHGDNQLGARASGGLSFRERFYAESRVRENYRNMFLQAECFLVQYKSMLSDRQIQLLQAFLRIPHMGRLGRITMILRCRLYKSTLLRTIGQMWSIG